jgi:hypothetical protein
MHLDHSCVAPDSMHSNVFSLKSDVHQCQYLEMDEGLDCHTFSDLSLQTCIFFIVVSLPPPKKMEMEFDIITGITRSHLVN